MEKELKRVKIHLFGKDYIVRTDLPAERLEGMAVELDNKLAALRSRYPNLTRTDVALLTALSLMEDLEKLREEKKELWELLGEATSKTPETT